MSISQVETPGSTASPASRRAFWEIFPAFRITESSRLVFSTICQILQSLHYQAGGVSHFLLAVDHKQLALLAVILLEGFGLGVIHLQPLLYCIGVVVLALDEGAAADVTLALFLRLFIQRCGKRSRSFRRHGVRTCG